MTAPYNKLYAFGAKYHMPRTEIVRDGDLGYIEADPYPLSLAIVGHQDDLPGPNLL